MWRDDRRMAIRSQDFTSSFISTGGQSISTKTPKRREKSNRPCLRFVEAEAGKVLREKITIITADS